MRRSLPEGTWRSAYTIFFFLLSLPRDDSDATEPETGGGVDGWAQHLVP